MWLGELLYQELFRTVPSVFVALMMHCQNWDLELTTIQHRTQYF